MQYRTLGGTGIRVSPYALGAMMFGGIGNPDHDDSIRIIHRALDAGINVIDTADRYSDGESEEIVGKALKGRREHVVLATKMFAPMGSDPNRAGLSRRWMFEACDESLKRLGTDVIDIYYLHREDHGTALEETILTIADLIRAGIPALHIAFQGYGGCFCLTGIIEVLGREGGAAIQGEGVQL